MAEFFLALAVLAILSFLVYRGFDTLNQDTPFNAGFNERAEQYHEHIGSKDPIIALTAQSMNSCEDYSRRAAQTELQKTKGTTETKVALFQQAGRESFDACMNLHLFDLQSTMKEDRLAVLKAGLKCDKGCPMRVIKGLAPWKDRSAMTLTHVRRR